MDLAPFGLAGELSFKRGSYLLVTPVQAWDEMPQELQRARIETLVATLSSEGLQSLTVMTDTCRTKAVGTLEDVFFIPDAANDAPPPKKK